MGDCAGSGAAGGVVGVHAQAVAGVVACGCDCGGLGGFGEVFGPVLVLAAAVVAFEGEGGGGHGGVDGEVGKEVEEIGGGDKEMVVIR